MQARTAELLQRSQLGISGYTATSRNYRLTSDRFSNLQAKIFQERDIAIQVAIGNYDLGICGYHWVEELTTKFPASDIVVIKGMGYGLGKLCVAVRRSLGVSVPGSLSRLDRVVALASENPNLAEAYAARLRLRRFRVFPVWGAAEVYPTFAADLAIFCPASAEDFSRNDLLPIDTVSSREAFLIANRRSWESVDLGQILDLLCQGAEVRNENLEAATGNLTDDFKLSAPGHPTPTSDIQRPTSNLRIALPDGHQQKHTVALLNRAGIAIAGYNAPAATLPSGAGPDEMMVRVIRPQDMPLQVASGNVDLAVTGKDWLRDHLCAFPSSPIKELLDLKFGRVKLVAVVTNEAKVSHPADLSSTVILGRPVRVASEYTNIADRYCRDRRLGHYKVIPTWGATEAFLPEDADMLIENTETGETLARHNLKVIDTVLESSGCLIGSAAPIESESRRGKIASLVEKLAKAV